MGAMDRRTAFTGCMLFFLLLAACADRRPAEYRLSGPTMGTTFNITVVTASGLDQEKLKDQIHAALEVVNRHMSTYRQDAELATFNRTQSTDWLPVSHRLCEAIEDALQLGALSNGAFDVTVGPLVDLWGFGPQESISTPPTDAAIDGARNQTGRDKLETDCQRPAIRKHLAGLRVDLSGYAKGLAADEIAVLLDRHDISNYLVEIGGDLRTRGRNASGNKWRIAIETPDPAGRNVKRIIHVSGFGVATSGDYRNFFEHDGRLYSHTIDPRTGRPVTHDLASVTVLAESAAFADAMATALLVLGPRAGPELADSKDIAAYFITRNGSDFTERTSGRFLQLTGH